MVIVAYVAPESPAAPVAGPGRTPMSGNNSGLSQARAIEPRYRPPEQRGILDGGLRGGGSG
jgi:hypothetical protein